MNNDLQNNDSQLDFLLKNMASGHQPELPSPSLVWWRAQIQKKLAEKQRVERPLVVMRMLAMVVCVAASGAVLAANWTRIASSAGQAGTLLLLGIFTAAMIATGSLLLGESTGKS